MKLIAESGATKTTWARIENGNFSCFESGGISPVTQSTEQITERIKTQVIPNLNGQSPESVIFYGTGVSSPERIAIIENALRAFFPNSRLEVEHDLLAAARAAYSGEITIVAILGTGASSCVFDGDKIITEVPSLGFILGDEGSGAHMGKTFIRDYIYGKVPGSIASAFKHEHGIAKDDVINHVYRMPDAPRWLASFTKFVGANMDEPYCRDLVLNSFRQFFDFHISTYSNYKAAPMNVIGSIAFHFQEQLKQVCNEYGFKFGRVIQTPIEELVKFHSKK
jgi:N-acetylglucosamine kinase-like BadF-type ATPase